MDYFKQFSRQIIAIIDYFTNNIKIDNSIRFPTLDNQHDFFLLK